MPITRTEAGDNIIYTVQGTADRETVDHLFDLNYRDYHEIGDAIGVVIDFRDMTDLTVAGLRAAQQRIKGVVFDTPVAFVGHTDSIMLAFLSGFEALSSKGRRRFRVFRQDEDPLAAALAWLEAWYEEHGVDRAAVRGRLTASPPLPGDEKEDE